MSSEFYTSPAVFAVNDNYQIMIPVKKELLMWVEIDGEKFFDEINGIIRSSNKIHKFIVPIYKLNNAGGYDICYRKVTERKPYYTQTEEPVCFHYDFFPIPTDGEIRIFHIADSHGNREEPVKCAKFFGKTDLLILNGDIVDHSNNEENFMVIYEICADITRGNIPCVFSRGNHDLRGVCADKLVEWSPTDNGKTYYTFKLGRIHGLVLDCGEDKLDSNEEYGNTVCCHEFRLRQTEFIKKLTEFGKDHDTETEYKIIIVHSPFTWEDPNPLFNIEKDIYNEWCRLICENIKPDLMLCGHLHRTEIFEIGSENDVRGQACPVIIGSEISKNDSNVKFVGTGLVLNGNTVDILFTEHNKIREKIKLYLKTDK